MRTRHALAVVAVLLVITAPGIGDEPPYGFRGFEIYKLDKKIQNLTVADVDGDGLEDLLITNNTKAKIEVFLRRKDPVAPRAKTGEKLPNDLVDDRFYERKEILTEKTVSAVACGDLNGDGRLDVAYYGKPAELVVAYGDGKGGFPKSTTFSIDDGNPHDEALTVGDLNGDGRTDLVLLAKGYSAILKQSKKGTLEEPVKVPHSVKGIHTVRIRDLNGDGRGDLVHLVSSSARSVRVRLQRADGTLGAETAFETSPWRFLAIHDVDPAPGAELLVIQRTSGILRALSVQEAKGAAPLGGVEIHAFEQTSGGKPRAMAIGDVDGDGRLDIAVTEPGTAQLALYLQGSSGVLGARRLFPSLSNSESIRVADLDGDGRAEVVVLSRSERAVGISSLRKDGRLPFPVMLSLPGVPKAVDTGDLNGDGRQDLVVVVEKDKKRTALLFVATKQRGLTETPAELSLKGLKQAPDDILVMDLDQDGKSDLLLFDRFGPMTVWRATADGGYVDLAGADANYRGGLVNRIVRGNVSTTDLDGDGKAELLVASKNFARAIRYDGGRGLQVADQANGSSPRSQIKGAVAIDVDADGKPEVALYDSEKGVVSLLSRNGNGVFGITANVKVGDFAFQSMFAADLNGDKRADLVIMGKNRFGILHGGGTRQELAELHTVESSQRDARLSRFALGDLNGDGKPDLAVLDSGNRGITIFSYGAKGFAQHLSWSIYEKKMHDNPRRDSGAREIVVEDLDGDGRNDIAVLVHDRLIVYPR